MTDGIYLPQSKVSRMLLQQLTDDGYCCNKNVSSDLSPEESGASGEIRTLKHLFLRQAAIPIRARWHSGAQGRI